MTQTAPGQEDATLARQQATRATATKSDSENLADADMEGVQERRRLRLDRDIVSEDVENVNPLAQEKNNC